MIFGAVTWFGAHINTPIIMIMEKAADFIRRREPLELVPAPRNTRAPEPGSHGGPGPMPRAARNPWNGLHNPVTPAYKLRLNAALRHRVEVGAPF